MNHWLWIHLSLIFSGILALILAVTGAALYLIQSRELKSKHPGGVSTRLPSLDKLDRFHFKSLSLGVILFTLGILSGFFWATDLRRIGDIFKDSKVILSLLTCLMYWAVLTIRAGQLRRGQKIAIGTLLIFALLIATWMSSLYAPSAFHKALRLGPGQGF